MFTVEDRDRIKDRLLELGKNDPRTESAALVGSSSGLGDRWSDLDITFGVRDTVNVSEVLNSWTTRCETEFQAIKLFDVTTGPSIYRVFLLPGNLQVDLSFTPSKDFGSLGPRFHLLWGNYIERKRSPQPTPDYFFGLVVHHLVRARICIEQGKLWQAMYWINEARNYSLSLACLCRGLETSNGRGFDSLPQEVLESFNGTFVSSVNRDLLLQSLGKNLEELFRNSEDVTGAASKLEAMLSELKSENLD